MDYETQRVFDSPWAKRMNTTLILIRHGETDANAAEIIQGQQDTALSEAGVAQAIGLRPFFRGLLADAVYTSDLSRAAETARLMCSGFSCDLIAITGLRERNYGIFEGLAYEEPLRRFPEEAGRRGDPQTEGLSERCFDSSLVFPMASRGDSKFKTRPSAISLSGENIGCWRASESSATWHPPIRRIARNAVSQSTLSDPATSVWD